VKFLTLKRGLKLNHDPLTLPETSSDQLRDILFCFLLIVTIAFSACRPSPEKLSSDLLAAVNRGDAAKVDQLLQMGANPSLSTGGQDSPLIAATKKIKFANPFTSGATNGKHIFVALVSNVRHRKPRLQLEGIIELTTEYQGIGPSGIRLLAHLYISGNDGKHELVFSPSETQVKGVELIEDAFQIRMGGRYRVVCTEYNGLCEADYLESIDQSGGKSGLVSIPSGDFFPSTIKIINDAH